MTELNEQARLRQILEFCLDKDLERILLTNPVFSGPGCYDKRGTDRSQPL